MKRNGKIARLPEEIREQLNERLRKEEPAPTLLAWLNALPEAVALVQGEFAGATITKQNLSEWRKGGYAEWSLRRSMLENALKVAERAREVGEQAGELLVDDLAMELTGRYAMLLADWDGKTRPDFEAKARLLRQICRDIVQLQRTTHAAISHNEEMELREEERDAAELQRVKRRELEPLFQALFRATGGGDSNADKIIAMIRAIQHDRPLPEFLPAPPVVKPSPSKSK